MAKKHSTKEYVESIQKEKDEVYKTFFYKMVELIEEKHPDVRIIFSLNEFDSKYNNVEINENVGGMFINHSLENKEGEIYKQGKDVIFINMARIQSYKEEGNTDILKTLLHEVGHYTGREHLLNRHFVNNIAMKNKFSAAFEEGIVEQAAFRLWSQLPFIEKRENIVQYSKDYINYFKNASTNPDPELSAIFFGPAKQNAIKEMLEDLFEEDSQKIYDFLKDNYIVPVLEKMKINAKVL